MKPWQLRLVFLLFGGCLLFGAHSHAVTIYNSCAQDLALPYSAMGESIVAQADDLSPANELGANRKTTANLEAMQGAAGKDFRRVISEYLFGVIGASAGYLIGNVIVGALSVPEYSEGNRLLFTYLLSLPTGAMIGVLNASERFGIKPTKVGVTSGYISTLYTIARVVTWGDTPNFNPALVVGIAPLGSVIGFEIGNILASWKSKVK